MGPLNELLQPGKENETHEAKSGKLGGRFSMARNCPMLRHYEQADCHHGDAATSCPAATLAYSRLLNEEKCLSHTEVKNSCSYWV